MDMQHEMRQPLEPIQEESEQEDGSIKSNVGEEEEDNFETPETEEVMAEDESEEEEEEEGNDGALSSRQLSRSLGRKSFSQTQSAFNHWSEMRNITAPGSADLTDEASSSWLPGHSHRKWRAEGFMVRKQQHKPLRQKNVRRRGSQRKPAPEPFPQWVVDLMVNIEEATTHRLVVE
ncbi:histone H3.v1-like [Betta splendens]|uniref:Histone H3.v1-like n=1 Tax=Betta splendens TaxID=158456 RepID=A0A6P7L2H3_BETSP|nr:histone H3.v1-like [Betta splendens]